MGSICKAGTLLMVDRGEYSDYSVTGFFVVLKDFDPMKELGEYKSSKKISDHFYDNSDKYFGSLISKEYLVDINYANLYLGGYGELESVSYTPLFDKYA